MQLRLTRAVKALLIAYLALFIIQQTIDLYFGGNFLKLFALIPAEVVLNFKVWQPFTYAFLHADVMHLFLNMLMLAFIGGELEALWGTYSFLRYYFFCSISAGLLYLMMQLLLLKSDSIYIPMVGASGGIYGLLVAYGLIFGERVFLFMLLFPMKAKHFIWILASVEFLTSLFSGKGGLGSIAHLGGMGAGFGFLLAKATFRLRAKRKGEMSSQRSQTQSHLKLIIDNERKPKKKGWDDVDDGPKTWH
jgi:membrane associated rhomboid family serine protease